MIREIKPRFSVYEWHEWFAWKPVTAFGPDGREYRVWWEHVRRREIPDAHGTSYEYCFTHDDLDRIYKRGAYERCYYY